MVSHGVYTLHTRIKKLEYREEISAVKELSGGNWVTCGDFNTVRSMGERRGCSKITNVMADFSGWIEDMELHDPHLNGGNHTWFRRVNHHSAARLDRFLYSMEWEETFKNIKQQIIPRVLSNHTPVMLQWGDWEQKRSNFKFENWWLKVDGFKDLIHNWWNDFLLEGCPDYKFSVKLKMLRQKLKEWRKTVCGELNNRKNSLFEELADIDLAQNNRDFTEDEMMIRATFLVELEAKIQNPLVERRQH